MKKLIGTLTSVKFWIIAASSVFFFVGKLTESGWITVILAFGGFRTVNELAGMYADNEKRKSKTGESAPSPEKTENPRNHDFGDS